MIIHFECESHVLSIEDYYFAKLTQKEKKFK